MQYKHVYQLSGMPSLEQILVHRKKKQSKQLRYILFHNDLKTVYNLCLESMYDREVHLAIEELKAILHVIETSLQNIQVEKKQALVDIQWEFQTYKKESSQKACRSHIAFQKSSRRKTICYGRIA